LCAFPSLHGFLDRCKKANAPFDFQAVWVRKKERTRGSSLSFLAFSNAWTQQLLPPNSFLNIYQYYTLEKFPCFFFLYSKSLFDIFFINEILLLLYSHWILDQSIGYGAGLNLIIMIHRHTTVLALKLLIFIIIIKFFKLSI
jgi:hypothetical protein